jgi:predicted HTH domain antitoxin
MDSISKYIDEKANVLYEGKKSFVQYLIEEGEIFFEQISDIAEVPLSFVQEVAKTRKR